MKKRLKQFWCKNLWPFCGIKKVKKDFIIEKDDDELFGEKLTPLALTKNEQLENHLIRQQNIKLLEDKGGVKRYLLNWIALTVLYYVMVFELIKPETFLERLITVPFSFIFFGMCFFMALFYYFSKWNK